MMRKLLAATLMLAAIGLQAAEKRFESPDGQIVVTVSDEGGKPTYKVTLQGTTVLETSPLGVNANYANLTEQLNMTDCQVNTVTDDYWLKTWKQSHVQYQATEAVCLFNQGDWHAMDIVFRVTNSYVAFRYKLYPKPARGSNILVGMIEGEASGFVLPEGTTTFLCPQATPMTGFARTAPSYETNYTLDDQMGKNGWGAGYTFPCLFKAPGNKWLLISETGTDGGYVGCRLLNNGGANYGIGFPQEGEMNGYGGTGAAVSLPCETPWRTITIGTTLAPIVESTAANDLVKPKYQASKDYTYGKGSWSWIIGMDSSCNFDEQKRYIDFSAAMGWRTVLVDALWDVQIGYERMEELSRYAQSRGVGLFLWYNSNGLWNDAPQSPKNKMDRSAARRQEMAWMQRNGILGIKVDFFGGDKQPMMQLYEDILTDANEFGLQVIFHGCTLPRGWERMYPNYVASEAVLASENMHFGQGMCDAEAKNACTHTFIRNVVGSMDFGGSTLNKHYNRDNEHGSTRRTSDVFALATAVLFQSSVQHFAMAPNNLQDAPGWAVEFMKQVPTQWDEVKFIDGYPGKFAIIARRSGLKWYLAGINAQQQTVNTRLDLSAFFKKGTAVTVYTDDAQLNGSIRTSSLKAQTINVSIPENGAFVIVGDAFAAADGSPLAYNNPMIFADVPDHDIIRVGNTYYMVSTTMHFAPGCGIMKSTDLVNWQIVNYAYDALDEGDNFRLLNGQNEYSQGQWATNLRYDPYERMYYMLMTCNTTGKSYFYVTDDIENGRWHCSTTDKCYDPGLLFDDTGTQMKKYVLHPADTFDDHAMYLREISVDREWNVTVGEKQKVIDYAQLENPARGLRAEGYHGYKIGDYYYIFMIQGCDGQRQEIVWRSRSLFNGQWEGRLVFGGEMTDANGNVVMRTNGIAQGGIVQAAPSPSGEGGEGAWWSFLFKDYGSVGRMPILLPMTWTADGWPVTGYDNHTTPFTVEGLAPHAPIVASGVVESDEFNFWNRPRSRSRFGSQPQNGLRLCWQWNHVPDAAGWSLTDRRGWLRLKPTAKAQNIREARNTLTQRTFGPRCSGETLLDYSGLNDGDVAGLSCFQNRYGFVGVKKEQGQFFVVMQRAMQKGDANGQEIERIPLASLSPQPSSLSPQIYLRFDANFENRTDKAIFFYSLDGEHWTPIGDTLQMYYDWPDFCGYRFALFHYATQQTGGRADFDFFHVN